MNVLRNYLNWLKDKQNIIIILLLTVILIKGCYFNVTYIDESKDKINSCILDNIEIKNVPEVPIINIANAKGDYKTKTVLLTEYVEKLRDYISDQKSDIDRFQNEVKEKCQK